MEKGNNMMDHIDANQTVRLFCQAWFEQRDAGAALEYVADDKMCIRDRFKAGRI